MDDKGDEPLEFLGLPIIVVEGWPDDQVAIVSPALADAIKRALARMRLAAEKGDT